MTRDKVKTLIAENERLRAACRAARLALAAAYGCVGPNGRTGDVVDESTDTVAPVDSPPPAWEAARARVEVRLGVRIWKFFDIMRYAPA